LQGSRRGAAHQLLTGGRAEVAGDGAEQPAPEGGRLQHVAEGAGDTGPG